MLSNAGLYLTELTPIAADLESVFLALTGDTPDPDRPGATAMNQQVQA